MPDRTHQPKSSVTSTRPHSPTKIIRHIYPTMQCLETQPTLRRTLCYYDEPPNGESPKYVAETNETPGKRNYPHLKIPTIIRDIRRAENSFSLDEHSFCALPGIYKEDPAQPINFNSESDIVRKFLPEAQRLLMENVPAAEQAVVFDYTVRRASLDKTPSRQVNKIHIDQSLKGAFGRARRHLDPVCVESIDCGDLAFRIVNLWKPIERPVKDHPLTFAECGSLMSKDLVPVPQLYPAYTGETYAVKYGGHQRFWFWSDMEPEDVLLLQCFDSQSRSQPDGGLQHAQCAHGSFELREDGSETFHRSSIEVRCLVVTKVEAKVE